RELVDAVGQLAEALLAFAYRGFGALASGDIESRADDGVLARRIDRDRERSVLELRVITLQHPARDHPGARQANARSAPGPQLAPPPPDEVVPGPAYQPQGIRVGVPIDPVDELTGRVALGDEDQGVQGGMIKNGLRLRIARAGEAGLAGGLVGRLVRPFHT